MSDNTSQPSIAPSLSAVILAGGRSSRMGTDKALLSIAGQPLIQRVCAVALQVSNAVRVVTPWPQRYRAVVPPSVHFIVEPTHQSQGPVMGLLRGMQQIQSDWVLVLACDLPCLDAPSLQQWQQQLPSLSPHIVAFLPHRNQRWEPLCGFYRTRCYPSLNTFTAAGGRSLQRWLAQQPVQPIAAVDPQQLFNLNTPADWDRLSQL